MALKDKFPHYWLCFACAEKRGGRMRKDSRGITMILAKCEYCGGKNQLPDEGLAPWVDYDWPEDNTADRVAKVRRD